MPTTKDSNYNILYNDNSLHIIVNYIYKNKNADKNNYTEIPIKFTDKNVTSNFRKDDRYNNIIKYNTTSSNGNGSV